MNKIIFRLSWVIPLLMGCWMVPLPLSVDVRLPELPPEWTGMAFRFSLRYIGADGEERWYRGLLPGESVAIVLARGRPVPVSAHPHGEGDFAPSSGFRCAGGVYPLDGGIDGPLVLAWTGGFLSELLFRLPSESRASLNLPRLKERIVEVSLGDPWSLDYAKLLHSLVYQSITSSAVKAAPLFSWSPPSGREGWWWGNPLFAELQRNLPMEPPGGALWIYPGVHRLFAPIGGARLLLEISEEGWRTLEHPGGQITSKRWD